MPVSALKNILVYLAVSVAYGCKCGKLRLHIRREKRIWRSEYLFWVYRVFRRIYIDAVRTALYNAAHIFKQLYHIFELVGCGIAYKQFTARYCRRCKVSARFYAVGHYSVFRMTEHTAAALYFYDFAETYICACTVQKGA